MTRSSSGQNQSTAIDKAPGLKEGLKKRDVVTACIQCHMQAP